MVKYTIYCTPEQTRKALELGAPIFTFSKSFADDYRTTIYDKCCSIPPIKEEGYEDEIYADIPTAEQILGWLEGQYIDCFVGKQPLQRFVATVCVHEELIYSKQYPSRKEATLAAIDAALEYLSNHKK